MVLLLNLQTAKLDRIVRNRFVKASNTNIAEAVRVNRQKRRLNLKWPYTVKGWGIPLTEEKLRKEMEAIQVRNVDTD